ncbi:heavy metal-responsive transcriptional regulator [Spirulina sp. CCNP1310]|uniref:heavy metal-responsive transcriptional regulator n=1 Tax=Spirulina sp. CCNP1310 TaxID=3110249 RepID=UPI003A4C5447
MLQLGEAARQLGLNPQTLYFYERIGLIPPPQRTSAGYRLFSPTDLERLAFIARAKTLGLSLAEIKEILALKQGRSLTCAAVYERLQQKVAALEAQIQQLQVLHGELVPLLADCERNLAHPDPAHQCVVLETSSPTFLHKTSQNSP